MLFALVSILTTLVVVANLFAPCDRFEYTTTTQTSRRRSKEYQSNPAWKQGRPLDRYHRQITVIEYKDHIRFEKEQQQERHEEAAPSPPASKWTPEQMGEMEGYYKRYLEVFYQTHGYDYEPEDKEVVYAEYLAFRERKAKEYQKQMALEESKQQKAEQETKAQLAPAVTIATSTTTTPVVQQQQHQQNSNDTLTDTDSSSRRVVADQIMVKPSPYTLDIDLREEQQREAARDEL